MIDVKNLKKSFGKVHVLNGITEHIEKGEKVVVIGPSGSGKSTFLRCLNLLETPDAGEIVFEGERITDAGTDIDKVRRKMGMVFQHFNLFPFCGASGFPIKPGNILPAFRADKNSAWPLPVRWR